MSAATPSKLAKTAPYIGTHDETFHCDDVTACYMLKSLTRFKDHDIVRTRDPDLLARAEIVVDVGGVLDVNKLRLDHHQRSFTQTIHDYHPNLKVTNPKKPVRLSSAGLVYAIFGKDYIVKQLELGETYADVEKDADKKRMIDGIYEKAYIELMEEIDAIDNGVALAEGDNLIYNYHVNSHLATRVAHYNPMKSSVEVTPDVRLIQFKKAMEMVGEYISDGIKYLGDIWWPNRMQFREFIMKRKEIDPSGQIVFVEDDEHMASWRSSVFELEEELGIVGQIKYIIYTDGSTASPWRATAVPVALKSFTCRVPLIQEWCGKRDEELQQVSGISDATFVHMNGFTGGALSRAGITRMVCKTLGLE